jgi:hypothetical protein
MDHSPGIISKVTDKVFMNNSFEIKDNNLNDKKSSNKQNKNQNGN